MSDTDKDQPVWVKALQYPDLLKPWHHWSCENHERESGSRACDLPETVPHAHGVRESWCQWYFYAPNSELHSEVYGNMNAGGCAHPRCTGCKQKRGVKRKDRRRGQRAARALAREALVEREE